MLLFVYSLSIEEQYQICCILVTAEYCGETTKQLQNKLVEKMGDKHKDKVNVQQFVLG